MLRKSDPASGSVIPMAPIHSPDTILGRYFCLASSVAYFRMYVEIMSECTAILSAVEV